MIRILVDGLIIGIAIVKWRKHQKELEKTFVSHLMPFTSYHEMILKGSSLSNDKIPTSPIQVLSSGPCDISYLRIKIVLTLSGDEFNTGAYIDLEGKGDFNVIHLILPMFVILRSDKKNGIVFTALETHDGIIIRDERPFEQHLDPFKFATYCSVVMPIQQSGTNLTISLPVSSGPIAAGLPMTNPLTISYPKKNFKNRVVHFPKIDKMELSIAHPPGAYVFDPLGQTPVPEYYSNKECRWITGTNSGMRSHSSVTSHLLNGNREERLQMIRLRDGIIIGIWTAVLVTVSIDCLWSMFELIRIVLK